MQRSCGFVFVCSINIYQDQWCSYFIMCKNHQGRSFPDVVLFRLLVWVSLDWPRNLYFFSSLNHFTEEWLTCKKLYIFNIHNSVSVHLWTITTIKARNISITFQSFLPSPLFLLLLLLWFVMRTLNIKSAILANFKDTMQYC